MKWQNGEPMKFGPVFDVKPFSYLTLIKILTFFERLLVYHHLVLQYTKVSFEDIHSGKSLANFVSPDSITDTTILLIAVWAPKTIFSVSYD